MKKIILIIIMVTTILPTTMAGTIKLYPTADTYTDNSMANSNFNNYQLKIGYDSNHGKHRTYLKFDLSILDSYTITNAVLSIDPIITIGSLNAETHYISSDSWSENTITWNNAPSHSSTITGSQLINSGNRAEFDILPLINEPDNILSIALISQQESNPNVYSQIFSTNGGDISYHPYLEVTYDGEDPTCPSEDFSNVCCVLTPTQMMNFINRFNNFEVSYTPTQMMNFINNFNQFEELC